MSSDEVAIQVRNVSKCYEVYASPSDRLKQFLLPRVQRWTGQQLRTYFTEFWALRDVSFEVMKGETVGIIGRNGSGKSTLLQVICGIVAPTAGEVATHGRVAALLELGSGFNPDFTGRENVYLNAALLGLTRREVDNRFDDIAAFADIGPFLDQPVKTYSSGMFVRLAFAVSINVDPDILIIDEALAVGDELFQRKCYSQIERIKDSGATVVLVTHASQIVTQLCSRVLLLENGAQMFLGNPKLAVDKYHRMLFGSPDDTRIVPDSRPSDGDPVTANADVAAAESSQHAARNIADKQAARVASPHDSAERYDLSCTPQSTMAYECNGAEIRNIRIENKHGEMVNVLAPGREYLYCYEVHFSGAATCVHFGMLIKTTTGIELGAAGSHPLGDGISKVQPGDSLLVVFSFVNFLSPGTYFMNAGCRGVVDDEDQFLHRIIDAVAFRVEIGSLDIRSTGPIQFTTAPPRISPLRQPTSADRTPRAHLS